jgi:hypothetical protein
LIPPVLAEALKDQSVINKASVEFDEICEGSKHHSPQPLLLRKISLVPWDGIDFPSVWICGICADNLAVFQHFLDKFDGEIPWVIQRQFGNSIRSLGKEGWIAYKARL